MNQDRPLELLPLDVLEHAAECLRIMAHPVRLRMVDLLMQGEFMVQQLAEHCAVQPHQACEHLRLMKGCGLLASERRGREVYYRIASTQLPALLACIRTNCGRPLVGTAAHTNPAHSPQDRPRPEEQES